MTVNQNDFESQESYASIDGENENRADIKIQEGVKLFNQKKWDNALSEFLSADTKDFSTEEKIELAYYLGLCYVKLNRAEEALSYLEQVVTANLDFLRVYQCRMTLALIYVQTDRVQMAEYELKRLQDVGLESSMLYNTLGFSAWIQKRYLGAVEFYEKSLDIDSDNPTALNSLGYILADTGIDVMKALRLCRKAVEFKPQNPAYLDSLGWAYYKSGNNSEAKTWLRRALDLAHDAQSVRARISCETEIRRHYKIVTGEEA